METEGDECKLRYCDFHGPFSTNFTVKEIEDAIARDDLEQMIFVPLTVSMDPQSRIWGEHVCRRLSTHPDPNVRGNALEGFGHLARIYRWLNRTLDEPVLLKGLNDEHPWVRTKALDAIEDIEWVLGWVFPGREHKRAGRICPP